MKVLILIKLLLIAVLGMASHETQAWWKCPTGHSIELRNNNTELRCVRPARTLTAAINSNCPQMQTPLGPVGAAFAQDYYRDRGDACVAQDPTGTAKTAVPHNFCASNYTHVKQTGRDICSRTIPASEQTATLDIP